MEGSLDEIQDRVLKVIRSKNIAPEERETRSTEREQREWQTRKKTRRRETDKPSVRISV